MHSMNAIASGDDFCSFQVWSPFVLLSLMQGTDAWAIALVHTSTCVCMWNDGRWLYMHRHTQSARYSWEWNETPRIYEPSKWESNRAWCKIARKRFHTWCKEKERNRNKTVECEREAVKVIPTQVGDCIATEVPFSFTSLPTSSKVLRRASSSLLIQLSLIPIYLYFRHFQK